MTVHNHGGILEMYEARNNIANRVASGWVTDSKKHGVHEVSFRCLLSLRRLKSSVSQMQNVYVIATSLPFTNVRIRLVLGLAAEQLQATCI